MYALSLFLVDSSPFLFLSSTCEWLRHCRDDEKHRNDKSADTIDVMCSLCRYESISFALLAGATRIMRVDGCKFTHLRLTRLSSADKWNSTIFDAIFELSALFVSFSFSEFLLFLVSILLPLGNRDKILLRKMIGSRS